MRERCSLSSGHKHTFFRIPRVSYKAMEYWECLFLVRVFTNVMEYGERIFRYSGIYYITYWNIERDCFISGVFCGVSENGRWTFWFSNNVLLCIAPFIYSMQTLSDIILIIADTRVLDITVPYALKSIIACTIFTYRWTDNFIKHSKQTIVR